MPQAMAAICSVVARSRRLFQRLGYRQVRLIIPQTFAQPVFPTAGVYAPTLGKACEDTALFVSLSLVLSHPGLPTSNNRKCTIP